MRYMTSSGVEGTGETGGVPGGGGSGAQRWRPKSLRWLEVLSVRMPDYVPPHFTLNRAHTFTIAYDDAAWPVRYRGAEHRPAAQGTVTVVEPDEVVQSLSIVPTSANFVTFTLLDSEPVRNVTANGELPTFGRLTYIDRGLFTKFAILHAAVTGGADDATVQSMLSSALATLVSRHATTSGATTDPHRPVALRMVQQLLNDRLDSNIRLDELAAVAGYNRHHLVRSFRQAYGAPPHRYRTLLRLATAKTLLAQDLPVTDVAARLGYCDQSQLNRHFREAFGVSAGAYARATR